MKLAQRLRMAQNGGDPYWSNTELLIQPRSDQVDGATALYDLSQRARTVARYGGIQIDTSLGYKTILCDGSGDYATVPHSDEGAWNFQENTTLEIFLRPSNITSVRVPITKRKDTPTSSWQMYINSDSKLYFGYYDTGLNLRSIASLSALSANTLYHACAERYNNILKFFINGVSQGQIDMSTYAISTNTEPVYIGRINGRTDRDYAGHIAGLRITYAARYGGSDFAAPDYPFPTS